ncbi:hypothetical protein HDV01_007255 [Terramyces sp. JEL0728]|nr:hypothetical protein HDV01_007255 [Terramyces sp. JEL0728]
MGGRRLRKAILSQLVQDGTVDSDAHIVLAGLSNIYTSYVTTYEEYLQQRYEAGSTIFGPHTLEAYINQFTQLAHSFVSTNVQLNTAQADREGQYTELSLNDQLIHHVVLDSGSFGKVNQDVQKTYRVGDTVSVKFGCAHPRNHGYFNKFAVVEQLVNNNWQTFINDGDWDIKFMWYRTGGGLSGTSECSVDWNVGETIPASPGQYRITTFGTSQNILNMNSTPEKFQKLLVPTIESLSDKYEFVFIKSPFIDYYDGPKEEFKGRSMLYWMEYGKELGFHHGFQEGFQIVQDTWTDEFEGMIAFSQGGVTVAACCNLVYPQPKWVLIYSAMFPKTLTPLDDYYQLINSFKGPCLYVSGLQETHLNIAVPQIQNAEFITHPLGHVVYPEQDRLVGWINSQSHRSNLYCIGALVDLVIGKQCKLKANLINKEKTSKLVVDYGKDVALVSAKITVLARGPEWSAKLDEYPATVNANALEFNELAVGTRFTLEIDFTTKLQGYGTDLIPFFKYLKTEIETKIYRDGLVYQGKSNITGCCFDIPPEFK